MLDAEQLKDFIADKWDIIPTVKDTEGGEKQEDKEIIVNGGFEDDLTGWLTTSPYVISTDIFHSGVKSLTQLESPSKFFQSFDINQVIDDLPVESVLEASYWVKVDNVNGNGGVQCLVWYTDGTFTAQGWLAPSDWTKKTMTLEAGKVINKIQFYSGSGSFQAWLDDVSLIATVITPIPPTKAEVFLALDEFNPNNPKYQIVFINNPARIIHISPNVTKLEQDIICEVHNKLIRYDPDTVEATRTIFKNMKEELLRIFTTFRYNNVGSVLNMSTWRDDILPHGFGEQPEPLEFVSRLIVEISEYKAINGTLIGNRVSRLSILDNDILGLVDVTFADTDPWVLLQIPKGPIIEQHLLGPHVHGEFTTHDWDSILLALYNTEIPENEDHYPINIDNSKSEFATNPANTDFLIELIDHLGNVKQIQFVNVKIQQIELLKGTTSGLEETVFRVKWMSDYYYSVPQE